MKTKVFVMDRPVIGLLLLLSVTLVGALKCPDNCECTLVKRGNLIHNHVRCTDVEALRVLGKTTDVDSLDLSRLNLTKITNQLDKLSSLSKLDLSENHLSEINSLRKKHIRSLNLAHNRLTSSKLLSIPEHVKYLDLSYNEITELPLEFKRYEGLKSLQLHGNPLNCSCETLEVRNWLQEKLVWTNHPIICAEPEQFKGKPWLQARQAGVCNHTDDSQPRILPYGVTDSTDSTDPTDDENDLMLGDDPTIGDVELTEQPEDDELVKDFIPVSPKHEAQKSDGAGDYDYEQDEYVETGSGASDDLLRYHNPVTVPASTPVDVYEGSGDEVTEIINTVKLIKSDDASYKQNDTSNEEGQEEDDGSGNLSRVMFTHHSTPNDTDSSEEDLTNTTMVNVLHHQFNESTSGTLGKISVDDEPKGETKEGKSTYILLAILAVILVVLILYVACKRDKKPAKQPVDDSASGARELLPVQKKPQPVTQNGSPEIVPLIAKNGKSNGNTDNNVNDLEGPLLQKLDEIEEPEVDENPLSEVKYENEIPASNATTAPVTPNNESQPASPKPSRYSPVSII